MTFTATDDCENAAVCTATIYVDDETDPTIDCPDDLVLECEDPLNADRLSAWLQSAVAEDNCDNDVEVGNDFGGIDRKSVV